MRNVQRTKKIIEIPYTRVKLKSWKELETQKISKHG